jgi:hypothetical protein
MECINQLNKLTEKLERQTKEFITPTPLTDRLRELGKQEPPQDFDISPIAEKAKQFITHDIYQYEK